MNDIIHTLRLEWKLIWSRRSVLLYLLTCFLAFTGTTLLMEQVVVGSEKVWVADVQRNLWIRPSTAFNCWMFWEDAWQVETLAVTVLYGVLVWGAVHFSWKKTIF